jgi:glycosyltransferase involved in cell wall biosynthesis
MNLLVVSFWLPPLLEPQSIQIGRLLAHLPSEFRQYVFTADHSTARRDDALYPEIDRRFAGLVRRHYEAGLPRRALRRLFRFFNLMPDPYLCWHFVNSRHISSAWPEVQFDRIVTFPCPMSSAVFGYWLKRRLKIPWITFMSDPWADNPYFGYKGLLKRINSRLEARVMESADLVVTPSEEMSAGLAGLYPAHSHKLRVLEHSFDASQYVGAAPTSGPLVLRYLGSYGGLRSAEPVFKALSHLSQAGRLKPEDLKLEMIGTLWRGDVKRYADLIHDLGLERIVGFLPPVAYLDSLRLMREAHALLLIDAPFDGSVYLPSKLVDYFGADRPLLAVTPLDGASARVVRDGGGAPVDPRDIEGIATAIDDLLIRYRSGALDAFRPEPALRSRFDVENKIHGLKELLTL